MKITFNEASHLQRVSSLEEAADIYQQFLATYMALEQDRRITNKIDFYGNIVDISAPITDAGNVVFDLQKVWGSRGRTIYTKLLTTFNAFASTKRTPVPNKKFTLDDVSFLIPDDDINSMLISLATLPKYEESYLSGRIDDDSSLELKNIAKPAHIEELEHRIALGIRFYEKNPKHKATYTSMGNGEQSSPMDLTDEGAQELLNKAISVGSEKVLYAVKDRKCYAFREHEPGKAVYHGYIVDNPSDKLQKALGLR